MTAFDFLHHLRARGVRLAESSPGVLTADAPRGVLTDADRSNLRRHKGELLGLLRAPFIDQIPSEANERLAKLRQWAIAREDPPCLWEAIVPALVARETWDWSASEGLRRRQWQAADALDAAYTVGDLDRLRQRVAEFTALMQCSMAPAMDS